VDGVATALAVTLLISLLVGLPVTMRAVSQVGTRGAGRSAGPIGLVRSPEVWLAALVGAIYLNQVLFTIYVIGVHGGDASFIAQHLPAGWFNLADDNGVIVALAQAFGQPHLLAASVLRIPAALELPLVVLAYLCVSRWWSHRLYRCLTTPAVLALSCATWTAAFCLIEWSLPNPYTLDNVVLRIVSAIVTAVAVARLAQRSGGADRGAVGRDAVDLALFGLSAGAAGYLLLVVYDTALLYNLGHLGERWAGAAVALGVLLGARVAAHHRRATDRQPGIGTGTVSAALGWFAALFFVPALPLRYTLGFGSAALAGAAGVVIAAVAAGWALREGCARMPRPADARTVTFWLGTCLSAGLAATAAAAAAATAANAITPRYPEETLLAAAGAFFTVVVATAILADRVAHRRGCGGIRSAGQAPPTLQDNHGGTS
jgi:hypothetical protein